MCISTNEPVYKCMRVKYLGFNWELDELEKQTDLLINWHKIKGKLTIPWGTNNT